MASVEKQTTVSVPVEQAFDYLADLSKHSEWGRPQDRLDIKKTSEGPVGQGSIFESVGYQFGKNEDKVTVTEYVPGQRLAYESEGNAGVIRHTFEFAPADGGTRLTKGVDIVSAKFPFALLAPIAKAFIIPGGLAADLERIKARLEGTA